jgi:hypothetical protein
MFKKGIEMEKKSTKKGLRPPSPVPNWYGYEINHISQTEKLPPDEAEKVLLQRIADIVKQKSCSEEKALQIYNHRISAQIEKELAIESVMKQKGVSREVAEAEVSMFL